MTDYFTSLNDKQREGVQTIQGPVLILAGAGSGKTKALTSRIHAGAGDFAAGNFGDYLYQ